MKEDVKAEGNDSIPFPGLSFIICVHKNSSAFTFLLYFENSMHPNRKTTTSTKILTQCCFFFSDKETKFKNTGLASCS